MCVKQKTPRLALPPMPPKAHWLASPSRYTGTPFEGPRRRTPEDAHLPSTRGMDLQRPDKARTKAFLYLGGHRVGTSALRAAK